MPCSGTARAPWPLFDHVHAAWERLLPEDHPDLLSAKQNLAATHKALGNPEAALELEEHVLATRAKLLPPGHPDLLGIELNLGSTRYRLGDLEGAHELFEHVHAEWGRLLPEGHPRRLTAARSLILARRALDDHEGAVEATRALLRGQLARARELRAESPRVARAAAQHELGRLAEALFPGPAEPGHGAPTNEVFVTLASLRLVSTSSREVALAAAGSPQLEQLRARATDARRRLNDLSSSPPESAAELEAWRQELVEQADERDRLERALRRHLAEEGVGSQLPSVASIAQGLPEDGALISFLRYPRRFARDPETGETPPSIDSLLAFVVSPDASVRRVELGPSVEIEELATRWRALLGRPVDRGQPVDGVREDEPAVGAALRARLLDPCFTVLDDGGPPAKVHVILDDFLHLVPLDALPWAEHERVGEVVPLRYEVSTGRLMRPPPAHSEAGTLVALGDVDFDAEDVGAAELRLAALATPPAGGTPDRRGVPGRFEPLVQSRYEVEALGGLYEQLVGGDPIVLERARATKGVLVELAPRARFLHVATHGWFAPETFRSMIDSAEESAQRELFARAEDAIHGFAPETLCGLALAGANHGKDELGRVPGIMTAEELATLDLAGCELAVLSACETNVGLRRAGQGIQSLQAALHTAGARTAVTSLWRVDDAATRRLMELFYTKLWGDGLGKAQALWQAKMALRAEGHPVRDWAAWVLTGDPD